MIISQIHRVYRTWLDVNFSWPPSYKASSTWI